MTASPNRFLTVGSAPCLTSVWSTAKYPWRMAVWTGRSPVNRLAKLKKAAVCPRSPIKSASASIEPVQSPISPVFLT